MSVKNPAQLRKDAIRSRDRRYYSFIGRCVVCGRACNTCLHHFYYSDVYDDRSFIEVCPAVCGKMSRCHGRFHR